MSHSNILGVGMKSKNIILIILSSFLASCAAIVLVGAAGGMIVYDKRSIPMIEKDGRIFYIINTDIAKDPTFDGSRVVITSFNKVVLLLGQVPAASVKVAAEKVARQTPNVYRVYNQMTVGQKISISQQSKDTWITSEIKSKMLAKKDLESGSIRVITEDSVVYLMGIVTPEQGDLAVSVARQVKGVQKVVKIFQYIR